MKWYPVERSHAVAHEEMKAPLLGLPAAHFPTSRSY
jgi:hypothetical protein